MTKKFGHALLLTKQFSLFFYKRAAALGSDDAADALKRMQCPFTMKDKDGKTAGSICFDGKN